MEHNKETYTLGYMLNSEKSVYLTVYTYVYKAH